MTDAPRSADPGNWLARYLAWRRRPDPTLARLQWATRALTIAVERAVVRRRLLQAELDATRRALDRAEAEVSRLTERTARLEAELRVADRERDADEATVARLRAALGTVKVAMTNPGLLATDLDLLEVVEAALSDAGGAGPEADGD